MEVFSLINMFEAITCDKMKKPGIYATTEEAITTMLEPGIYATCHGAAAACGDSQNHPPPPWA